MTSKTLGTWRCLFGTCPSSLENLSSFKHIKEGNKHRFKNRNIYAIFKILITLGNINDWKNTDSDFFLSSEFEHRNHQILTLIIILCVTVSPFDMKYMLHPWNMPLIDLYADCKTAMINSSSLAMNWIIYHIQASTPKSKPIP